MSALSIILAYSLVGAVTARIATRDRRDSFGVSFLVQLMFTIGWPLMWALVIRSLLKGDQS